MGHERMGPPRHLVLELAGAIGADTFVETGTYRGDTVAWARDHFSRVISFEASKELSVAASRRFARDDRVTILHEDSGRGLPALVEAQITPAVYWLDAHWSGGATHGVGGECPLLAELDALDAAVGEHVVFVDDARCFGAPPPRPHRMDDWPDLTTVVTRLGSAGKRWVGLFEDAFIGVPAPRAARARAALQEASTVAWRRHEDAGTLRRWIRGRL